MYNLDNPIFQDEEKAREYLESVRWPYGPACVHCGEAEKIKKLAGKAHRPGVYQCASCRKQFTVTVGTLFERSKIPLHKWLLVTYLITSSKKGISSHQVSRMLDVTYKTAWFMTHRIREAMRPHTMPILGSDGGAVEADETFIGHDKTIKPTGQKKGRGFHHKYKVLSLVERNTGRAQSIVLDNMKATTIGPILRENIAKEAKLMTDEASYYTLVGRKFAKHGVVHHQSGEYGRGDIHSNTVEGYFSIFKRGMKGIYQHCGKKHLHRYLAEFDFRYSNRSKLGINDDERAELALQGIEGKRLTYR